MWNCGHRSWLTHEGPDREEKTAGANSAPAVSGIGYLYCRGDTLRQRPFEMVDVLSWLDFRTLPRERESVTGR